MVSAKFGGRTEVSSRRCGGYSGGPG
jgi:hypothetical protein